MYFPLFLGVLCLSWFCYYASLCVHSSFVVIIWCRKRKLVVLLLFSYRCIVTINVLCLLPHDAMGWSAGCDYVEPFLLYRFHVIFVKLSCLVTCRLVITC